MFLLVLLSFWRLLLQGMEKQFLYSEVTLYPVYYLDFLSRSFTIHRTSGKGGGCFFNSSLPLPPASQTPRHQPSDCFRHRQRPDSNATRFYWPCTPEMVRHTLKILQHLQKMFHFAPVVVVCPGHPTLLLPGLFYMSYVLFKCCNIILLFYQRFKGAMHIFLSPIEKNYVQNQLSLKFNNSTSSCRDFYIFE